jgi:hypothetical protein
VFLKVGDFAVALEANYSVIEVGKSLKILFTKEVAFSQSPKGHQLV